MGPAGITSPEQPAARDKTGKPDFDYNQGVPLWHSSDLKSWKSLGLAWDRVALYQKGRHKLGIWLDWSVPADRIDGLLAQATTTPQLCRIGNDWFIVLAMNGQNILLQKSTTGKAEGPYDDFAYLATRGGHPSLLVDDDGTVYLVFADAWIAKLKPDLKELAEDPRLLLPVPNPDRLTLGDPGVRCSSGAASIACSPPAGKSATAGRATTRCCGWPTRSTVRTKKPAWCCPAAGRSRCFPTPPASGTRCPASREHFGLWRLPSHEDCLLHGPAVAQRRSAALAQKEEPPRSRLQPLFDTPLRDTSICKGGDAWYLTGAVADFQNNDGIRLWRSTDCETWKDIGPVWSIERQGAAWQKQYRVNPDNPSGPLVRGMVSPEIHFHKNTYWITYSMNAQGTGLLKSTTGKPEGPYKDLGRFTGQGTDASLFVDDDGTGYWLVGQGWLAKLKPDWTGLAEHPQLLRCVPFPAIPHGGHEMSSTHAPRYLGRAGAHLFKTNGRYYLIGAAVRDRLGVGCYDTFVACADKITGPYNSPNLMIAHGGQTTVFKGPDDQWWATFCGATAERSSATARRSCRWSLATPSCTAGPESAVALKKAGIVTEFGPWDKVPKVAPYHIRDLQFSFAPDGYAYLTGSGTDPAYTGRIMVFRSKDMKQWKPVDVQFDYLTHVPGATPEDYEERFGKPRRSVGWKASTWIARSTIWPARSISSRRSTARSRAASNRPAARCGYGARPASPKARTCTWIERGRSPACSWKATRRICSTTETCCRSIRRGTSSREKRFGCEQPWARISPRGTWQPIC